MPNPENENRFLKDLLRGVPNEWGLTRQEQEVKMLARISDDLRGMRSQLPVAAQRFSPVQHIHVDVPDPSRSLAPHLQDIARNQMDTMRGMHNLAEQGATGIRLQRKSLVLQDAMLGELEDQTDQGEIAIDQRKSLLQQGNVAAVQRQTLVDQSRLTIMLLESLDDSGRAAYVQRMGIISGLYATQSSIERLDAALVEGKKRLSTDLKTLQQQGSQALERMRQQTELLDKIAQLEMLDLEESLLQTSHLAGIQNDTAHLVIAARESIQLLATQNSVLADIANQITINNELAAKTADHLSHIESSIDMVVLTARDIRQDIGRIVKILQTPVRTRAYDLWDIGEQCRRNGDIESAFQKFKESHKENPAEARNYYSLGMICLEIGTVNAARDFFEQGLAYAKQEGGNIISEILLALGKIAYITYQYAEAKDLLEKALEADKKNIDIWYQLALVEMKLNNHEKAIYYLNNLLYVAHRKYPAYVEKVLHDPEFSSILKYLQYE